MRLVVIFFLILSACSQQGISLKNSQIDGSDRTLTQNMIDFGSITSDTPLILKTITVNNTSTSPMNVSIGNFTAPFFMLINHCQNPLSPGQSCEIIVSANWRSVYNGSFQQIVQVGNNNYQLNTAINVPGNYDTSKQGQPMLSAELNFPFSYQIDQNVYRVLSVSNIGTGDAKITNLVVNQPADGASDYSILLSHCTDTLKPGQSCQAFVLFSKFRETPYFSDQTMQIKYQGPDGSAQVPLQVPLYSGNPISACPSGQVSDTKKCYPATMIHSATDLVTQITNNPAGYYQLTQDIDLSAVSSPLPNFTGVLDGTSPTGQSYKLSGLVLNNKTQPCQDLLNTLGTASCTGLFASIGPGAVIRNIGLENILVQSTSGSFAGALAGIINGGLVLNVKINNSTISSGQNTGGLVGNMYAGEIHGAGLTNSYVTSTTYNTAGIVAKVLNESSTPIVIDQAIVSGSTITAQFRNAAGIIHLGESQTNNVMSVIITNSKISGSSVTAGQYCGGFARWLGDAYLNNNSVDTVNVTSKNLYAAGFIVWLDGYYGSASSNPLGSIIKNAGVTNSVISAPIFTSGFVDTINSAKGAEVQIIDSSVSATKIGTTTPLASQSTGFVRSIGQYGLIQASTSTNNTIQGSSEVSGLALNANGGEIDHASPDSSVVSFVGSNTLLGAAAANTSNIAQGSALIIDGSTVSLPLN